MLTDCDINYFRLVKLTMIEGTKAIRNTVLRLLPNGQTLQMILSQKEEKFRELSRGARSVINKTQLAVLYPPNGNCVLSDIDMTLWCILARNLLHVPPSASANWGNDDHPPLPEQTDWYHDVVRIRLTRNRLFHLQGPELHDETFEDLWNYVSDALSRLVESVDFEGYRTAEYDRSSAREFEMQVKEQVLQEMNDVLRTELGGRRRLYGIVAAAGTIVVAFLIVTIVIVVINCTPKTPCEKGVQYQVAGRYGGLYFVPRSAWGAEKPSGTQKPLHLPTPHVIYTHTADMSQCVITQECCIHVKTIQYLHMHQEKPFCDIAFHYLIDGNGYIYKGRSQNTQPNAVPGWNHNVTSIALLGNYMYDDPSPKMIGTFNILLGYLMETTHTLPPRFTMYAMCEVSNNLSPGIKLYNMIKNLNKEQYPFIANHVVYREGMCSFV